MPLASRTGAPSRENFVVLHSLLNYIPLHFPKKKFGFKAADREISLPSRSRFLAFLDLQKD